MANSKKCFTHEPGMSLTEVIIAMLVIGVICAILIPLFKGLFYDKQEFKTKSLKAYQGVNQVLLMNKTQHGQALSPWKNQGIEWVKDNFAAMNVVKYLDESECSNLFVEVEDDVRMCFLNRDGIVYGFVVDGDEQGNVSSNLYIDVNAKKSPNELTAKKSDPRDQWMMKYDRTKGRYEFVLDKPEAPENGPGCEPGTYVINGKCAKCPSGKTYNAYEKKCEDPSNDPTKCEEQGGVMVDGKCMICKTGTKYDSEKKLCLSTGDCSDGETQTGGVCMCEGEQTDDGCMLCPNGYTYNEDQDKCMPGSTKCEEGFSYNSSTGLCEKPKSPCDYDEQCGCAKIPNQGNNSSKGFKDNDCYCSSTYKCTYPNGGWTEYFCGKPKNIYAYQINNEDRKKIKSGGVFLEGNATWNYTDCRIYGYSKSTYCPNDPDSMQSYYEVEWPCKGRTYNSSEKEIYFCENEGFSCKGRRKIYEKISYAGDTKTSNISRKSYEARSCYVAATQSYNSTEASYWADDKSWTCQRYNFHSTTKLCSSDPRGGGCNTWTTGHPDYNPISFYYDRTDIYTRNNAPPSYIYIASNGGICGSASCGANTASDAPGWGFDDTAPACPSWAK